MRDYRDRQEKKKAWEAFADDVLIELSLSRRARAITFREKIQFHVKFDGWLDIHLSMHLIMQRPKAFRLFDSIRFDRANLK